MEEQLSVQELAAEMRNIKSSLLAIQDFLGTLNVKTMIIMEILIIVI